MKKILSLLTALLAFALVGFSQAPGFFNYQGVARNSVGNVLKNQSINLRLTITDGTANGPSVYQESRQLVTNPFGLFNVQVGSGGASNVSGTISGVNWSVGAKFIKVEIDPAGGTNFLSIGSAQLASVPFSLFATTAGDIVLPFNKTQSDAGSLFKVTNSGSGAGSTALEGLTNSQAGNASAVIGTVTNTTPGGFSAGVKGINNGTGGLGIGVYGVQNGSGSGVYGTTPSGIGVNGNSTSGTGVNGTSNSGVGVAGTSTSSTAVTGTSGTGVGVAGTSTSNTAVTGTSGSGVGVAGTSTSNTAVTGTSGTGVGVAGISTSANAVSGTSSTGAGVAGTSNTGFGGFFEVTNPASTADAVRAVTGGTGASWAIRGISTGTNGAGLFQQTNATNTSNNLQSNQAGLGRAGLFNSTNAASTANAVDINVAGTGFALRAASSNATPKALLTSGGLQLTGIGEAANSVLVSDATGNATWQTVGAIGAVTGSGTLAFIPKWTPSGTQLGNSLLFDDGSSIGLGTTTPTHRLNVSHSGSTGIGVTSTSGFSVIDIDAASGDAALRFARAGVNQWNTRNRPADDYYEIFELGGGGGSRFVIQDGTGNVGIGETANPTYKLDVLHGGSTGIRSRSSSSFSVIDIDGQSGDAALRFAKAGVNQWNIRNRPADDYLEIFELGGGGSRFVIQDATGNVGIGETTSPSYKLDVLHGGSTGIRSRSSSSFSVVDIDGQSGDAALRFAKAGVNQWNTRNNPGTDDYQIFELGGGGERMRIDNTTGKVWVNQDFTVVGVKAFTMDHPLDPANKILMHAAAESNEVINFYSGNITTDATGKAIVQLPNYYEALNKDSRYQLTVIGSFAQAIISKEVSNNQFEIATSTPNVKVSWEVKGVRNDARMIKHPFVAEEMKSAAQRGKYIDPASHNQPMSKHVSYDQNIESSLSDVKPASKKVAPPTTGGSLDQAPIVAPVVANKAATGGSLDQGAIVPPVQANKAATGGSLEQGAIVAPVLKAPVEKGGSIEDMPTKKVEAKPAPSIKGSSVESMPTPVESK